MGGGGGIGKDCDGPRVTGAPVLAPGGMGERLGVAATGALGVGGITVAPGGGAGGLRVTDGSEAVSLARWLRSEPPVGEKDCWVSCKAAVVAPTTKLRSQYSATKWV